LRDASLEVFPAVDGDSRRPVHEYLLAEHGVHITELHHLEQLAADRRYEFCYVAYCRSCGASPAGSPCGPSPWSR